MLIRNLATTATTSNGDDYLAQDGATGATRKIKPSDLLAQYAATYAQVAAGQVASVYVPPSQFWRTMMHNLRVLDLRDKLSTAYETNVGTGDTTQTADKAQIELATGATSASSTFLNCAMMGVDGAFGENRQDFSKFVAFGFQYQCVIAPSTNGIFRCGFWTNSSITPGTTSGVWVEIRATRVWLGCRPYLGSTTYVDTGLDVTNASNNIYTFSLESFNGTVTLLRNNAVLATTTGGPNLVDDGWFNVAALNGADASNNRHRVSAQIFVKTS